MPIFTKYGVPVDTLSSRDTVIQPKSKFKFRVRFLNFGGLESASYSFDTTQQVISVQRPTIEFSSKEIGTYAGTLKVFNKPNFRAISMRFRDDMANSVSEAIWSQLQKQYDFLNGRYAVSSGAAKFVTIIETLDGNNESRAVDSFVLEGCYINSSEFGDLNYAEGGINEIAIGIDYDYIGSYYSETDGGINDPDYLMWYVTSQASAYASPQPLSASRDSDVETFTSDEDSGFGF